MYTKPLDYTHMCEVNTKVKLPITFLCGLAPRTYQKPGPEMAILKELMTFDSLSGQQS